MSPLFSDFRGLSCHCGRQRSRLRKSQPRGEEGGPARSEALQAGKTEVHRESDLGSAPGSAPEATADAERTLDNSHQPLPRGQTPADPPRATGKEIISQAVGEEHLALDCGGGGPSEVGP